MSIDTSYASSKFCQLSEMFPGDMQMDVSAHERVASCVRQGFIPTSWEKNTENRWMPVCPTTLPTFSCLVCGDKIAQFIVNSRPFSTYPLCDADYTAYILSRRCSPAIIGNNILAVRNTCHLSQRQVAEAIDISPPTLGKFEKGMIRPTLSQLIKLATTLHIKSLKCFINQESSKSHYNSSGCKDPTPLHLQCTFCFTPIDALFEAENGELIPACFKHFEQFSIALENPPKIGQAFKRIRESNKWSVIDLANHIPSLTPPRIYELEFGSNRQSRIFEILNESSKVMKIKLLDILNSMQSVEKS